MNAADHSGKLSPAKAGQCLKRHAAQLTQLVCIRDEQSIMLRKSILIPFCVKCGHTAIARHYGAQTLKSTLASGLPIKLDQT